MQGGFGLLESGMVTTRFSVNVLMKISANVAVVAVAFFLTGWSLSFTECSATGFSGCEKFLTLDTRGEDLAHWIYQLSIASLPGTIISSSVSGRMSFPFFLILAFLIGAVIYPIAAHWSWFESGWLISRGYFDWAGAGPLHLTISTVGLVCAVIMGPRQGVFTEKGAYIPIRSNPPSTIFGSLLLIVGWFTLNATSEHTFNDRIKGAANLAAVNSAVASGAGVVAAMILLYYRTNWRSVDVNEVVISTQGALVSICACCGAVEPYEAAIIGIVGSLLSIFGSDLMVRLRVDDPIGIFGSHFVASIWAILAAGLFLHPLAEYEEAPNGLFRGGGFRLLGHQLVGIIAFTAWGLVWGGLVLMLVGRFVPVRLSPEDECIGSDIVEHDLLKVTCQAGSGHFGGAAAGAGAQSRPADVRSIGSIGSIGSLGVIHEDEGLEISSKEQRGFAVARPSVTSTNASRKLSSASVGFTSLGLTSPRRSTLASSLTRAVRMSNAGYLDIIVTDPSEQPDDSAPLSPSMDTQSVDVNPNMLGSPSGRPMALALASEDIFINICTLDILFATESADESGAANTAAGSARALSAEQTTQRRPTALARRVRGLTAYLTDQMHKSRSMSKIRPSSASVDVPPPAKPPAAV